MPKAAPAEIDRITPVVLSETQQQIILDGEARAAAAPPHRRGEMLDAGYLALARVREVLLEDCVPPAAAEVFAGVVEIDPKSGVLTLARADLAKKLLAFAQTQEPEAAKTTREAVEVGGAWSRAGIRVPASRVVVIQALGKAR